MYEGLRGVGGAGECAGGLHGANRLGGNSLSDLLVFGRLAGAGSVEYIQGLKDSLRVVEADLEAVRRSVTDILNRESGENPYLVHEELQKIMQENVGIVRTKEDLEKGLAQLTELKKKAANVKAPGASQYNAGWHEAIDLHSLIVTAEAVARAGLVREESRGAHTRVDFEGEREEWGHVNVVIRRDADGNMEVRKVERGEPPAELAKIAYATLEELEGTGAGA
jgi:succinate dehydrogenase / fumarate reductase flavoprotein subunit